MAAIDLKLPEILVVLRAVKDALLPYWRKLKADDKAELADVISYLEKAQESLGKFIYKDKEKRGNNV